MTKITRTLLILVFLLSASFSHAGIIPIDLNDFFADPTAVVSTDGSSAVLSEDQSLGTVLLSNDPSLGDPGIVVPSGLMWLRFDYNFTLGPGNNDNFYAKVFDGYGAIGDFIDEFRIENISGSGTVAWSLQGVDPSITLLGLEFQLNSSDSLYDSFVTISKVQMEVPEPGTLVLLFSGLLGLMRYRKKTH